MTGLEGTPEISSASSRKQRPRERKGLGQKHYAGIKTKTPSSPFSILIPGLGGQEPQSLHTLGRPREGHAG